MSSFMFLRGSNEIPSVQNMEHDEKVEGGSTLPWLCIGDFNEILRPEEQFGPNERDSAQIEAFREAVDICGLADLGYRGLDWTWQKKVAGGIFAESGWIEHWARLIGLIFFHLQRLNI